MKLEFDEVLKRKFAEIVAKLNDLHLTFDAFKMSGVATMNIVVNLYEGEVRPVQIIGVFHEGGKVQFRAEREDTKNAEALIYGNRESAEAIREILAYEYRSRTFAVWTVRAWMEHRIKTAYAVYNSLEKLA